VVWGDFLFAWRTSAERRICAPPNSSHTAVRNRLHLIRIARVCRRNPSDACSTPRTKDNQMNDGVWSTWTALWHRVLTGTALDDRQPEASAVSYNAGIALMGSYEGDSIRIHSTGTRARSAMWTTSNVRTVFGPGALVQPEGHFLLPVYWPLARYVKRETDVAYRGRMAEGNRSNSSISNYPLAGDQGTLRLEQGLLLDDGVRNTYEDFGNINFTASTSLSGTILVWPYYGRHKNKMCRACHS